MSEADFWVSLEFRLCHEFAGLTERRCQYFWCDGLIPSEYILDDVSPRISGRCWICNGQRQAEWEFTLLLPKPFRTRAEIDWHVLLPPSNSTRWMAFDETRRYVEIDPAVAGLDRAVPGTSSADDEAAR